MTELPESVAALLKASIRRVRRIYILRGVAASLAALIAAATIVMIVDARFMILSDSLRWMMSFAIYVGVVSVAAIAIVVPLMRRLDFRRIARVLDERHPGNEECLTTLVELCSRDNAGVSPSLLKILSAKAVAASKAIDLEEEFTSRTIVRKLRILGVAVVALIVAFILLPHQAGRLFVRAVAPWVDCGNLFAGSIKVAPGDIVACAGQEIRIEASATSSVSSITPVLRISRLSDGSWGGESAVEMVGGVYRTIATMAESDWRYRVQMGPAVTKYYMVKVRELPRCECVAEVKYPDYTGRLSESFSGDELSSLSVLAGSHVHFSLKPDFDGTKVEFSLDGGDECECTAVSNKVFDWRLDLTGAEGLRAPTRRGAIRSVIDTAPTLLIESPAASRIKLPPYAKFTLAVTASDDVGVKQPVVRRKVDKGKWETLRTIGEFEPAGMSLWKGTDEIDLSMFALEDVKEVAFDLVIEDLCPPEFGGPHAVTSQPVVVILENRALAMEVQDIAAMREAAAKLATEAERRLSDATRAANEAKAQLKREQKVSENSDRRTENAVHDTDESIRRLEELTRALREDGRYEPIADRFEKMLSELHRAREQLERAEFADVSKRSDALEDASAKMQKAVEELRRVRDAMNKRTGEIEKFERTRDLAARQEALTRAAEEILRERPLDTRKLEAWKRMEEATAAQADEMTSNRSDPELDEARRKMMQAAAKMDEMRREIENRKNARNEQDFQCAMDERRNAVNRDMAAHLQSAERIVKDAEAMARQREMHDERWMSAVKDNLHRAAEELAKADAPDRLREKAARAESAAAAAIDKSRDAEDALAKISEARRGITALQQRRKAEKEDYEYEREVSSAKKDLQSAINNKNKEKKANAERRLAEAESRRSEIEARREREVASAREAAINAQRDATSALESGKTEDFKKAAEAAERAAEEMSKSLVPEALQEAQEAALAAIRERARADRHKHDVEMAMKDAAAKKMQAAEAKVSAETAENEAKAARKRAAEAEDAAIAAQRYASEKQSAARAAQKEAVAEPTSAAQSKASAAQRDAAMAQQRANEEQTKAAAVQLEAMKASEKAAKAAEDSAKAREEYAKVNEAAALKSDNQQLIEAAAKVSERGKSAAEAAREESARRAAANAAANEAQREAVAAQSKAVEAQSAAADAQHEADAAADKKENFSEFARRAAATQAAAEAAQAEAAQAQERARSAMRAARADDGEPGEEAKNGKQALDEKAASSSKSRQTLSSKLAERRASAKRGRADASPSDGSAQNKQDGNDSSDDDDLADDPTYESALSAPDPLAAQRAVESAMRAEDAAVKSEYMASQRRHRERGANNLASQNIDSAQSTDAAAESARQNADDQLKTALKESGALTDAMNRSAASRARGANESNAFRAASAMRDAMAAQSAARDALEARDLDNMESLGKASEMALAKAADELGAMLADPSLVPEMADALREAMTAEREASKSQSEASDMMRQYAANPNNGWSHNAARDRMNRSEASQHTAQEAFDRAMKAMGESRRQGFADQNRQGGSQSSQPASQSQTSSKSPSQSDSGSQGQSRSGEMAAQASQSAADKLSESVAKQGRNLGLPTDSYRNGGKGEGKGMRKDEGNGSGSGHVGEELSQLAKRLDRHDDPGAMKAFFEKMGWFKVQGSSKSGLSAKELEKIPAEYRDLVRAYFLKLAE